MRRSIALFFLLATAFAQNPVTQLPREDEEPKFPDGTSQHQAILKAEYKRNLQDAARLKELSAEVQADLEKSDANIVSLKTLKQLDEIEKLTKSIRSRLKR